MDRECSLSPPTSEYSNTLQRHQTPCHRPYRLTLNQAICRRCSITISSPKRPSKKFENSTLFSVCMTGRVIFCATILSVCWLGAPSWRRKVGNQRGPRPRENRAGSFFAPVNGPIGPVFSPWNAPARRQGDEEPPAVCHL
jgi:hypothetical protein